MRNNSRTTNTILNFTSSVGGQLLTVLAQFVTRTVFIVTLGKAYLGINGLFSNILTMLSLAEFGVGSAILFKLYEPIAQNDQHRITVLMKFYKNAYRVIGLAVAIIGISLIPFLPLLINDYDKLVALNINAVVVFLLYLFRTVTSYWFFAYRSSIIKANQKEYLINLVSYVFIIITAIIQIVCLYVFCDFVIYIIISIFQVIGQNLCCAIIADKMYPYINEKTEDKIDLVEIKDVIKDCGALFLYKLNGVVIKATDNIVISIFLGLDAVGLYSNYYILYGTVTMLFSKIYNAVAHSLGNLHTKKDRKYEYGIFEVVNLITAVLGGTAFVGIFICADEFVYSWLGQEWVISMPFALLMGLELYTFAFRVALGRYRNTMGLFQQAKYRPLFGMIINLIVSVALVNTWGICGVLVGTIIADWTTMMWFDPIIIHKYGFENIVPVHKFFIKFTKYFLTVCIAGLIDYLICTHVCVGYKWISVICHALICAITVPGIMILTNYKSNEGKYVFNLFIRYFNNMLGKIMKH